MLPNLFHQKKIPTFQWNLWNLGMLESMESWNLQDSKIPNIPMMTGNLQGIIQGRLKSMEGLSKQ